jgi:hypothetical protein
MFLFVRRWREAIQESKRLAALRESHTRWASIPFDRTVQIKTFVGAYSIGEIGRVLSEGEHSEIGYPRSIEILGKKGVQIATATYVLVVFSGNHEFERIDLFDLAPA